MKLRDIKNKFNQKGRDYKCFSAGSKSRECNHSFLELKLEYSSVDNAYQCQKCGMIVTDDFYDPSYYIQKVNEFKAH